MFLLFVLLIVPLILLIPFKRAHFLALRFNNLWAWCFFRSLFRLMRKRHDALSVQISSSNRVPAWLGRGRYCWRNRGWSTEQSAVPQTELSAEPSAVPWTESSAVIPAPMGWTEYAIQVALRLRNLQISLRPSCFNSEYKGILIGAFRALRNPY